MTSAAANETIVHIARILSARIIAIPRDQSTLQEIAECQAAGMSQ